MALPSVRSKLLPVRGLKASLDSVLADLLEGEICYATDEDQYYQVEGGSLVQVGASKGQGALADSALQPGDLNPVLFSSQAEFPSAADNHGAIAHSHADGAMYFAHAGSWVKLANDSDIPEGFSGSYNDLTDTPTIPTDNSELTNGAGYITSADIPDPPVLSVAGKTGTVLLNLDDIEDVDLTTVPPITGEVLGWNGSEWVPTAQAEESGTDLSYNSSTREVVSSTGNNATLPEVVAAGDSGLMTGADKTKLDGIAAGAQVNVGTDLGITTTTADNTITSSTGSNVTIAEASSSAAGLMSVTLHDKLDGIETGATADQTGAEIKSAYEAEADTNAFTDAEKTKLSGIAAGAEVNVDTNLSYTASTRELASSTGTNATLPEVVAAGDSGLMTGADKTKLDGIAAGATNVTNNNQLTNGAGYITSADGGNAATLDGLDSSQFLRSDANDTYTGTLTFSGGLAIDGGTASNTSGYDGTLYVTAGINQDWGILVNANSGKTEYGMKIDMPASYNYGFLVQSNGSEHFRVSSSDVTIDGSSVWHAGNDGSGSGLDADLLDGQHGSYFLDYNNFVNTPAASSGPTYQEWTIAGTDMYFGDRNVVDNMISTTTGKGYAQRIGNHLYLYAYFTFNGSGHGHGANPQIFSIADSVGLPVSANEYNQAFPTDPIYHSGNRFNNLHAIARGTGGYRGHWTIQHQGEQANGVSVYLSSDDWATTSGTIRFNGRYRIA